MTPVRPLNFLGVLLVYALAACSGDPVAGHEVGCSGAAPATRGWYPSITPFEGGSSSERNHVFAAACSAVNAAQQPALTASAENLPGVYNAVTRGDDSVYLLGGSYGRIDTHNAPFVAAYDSRTLVERWRQRLPGIDARDWNYPGALGLHPNGKLYAIYGHHLVRLDPDSGRIERHTLMPARPSAADVAYNGYVLLGDGNIAAKSIHRQPGCDQPDFKAFFQCDTRGMAASTLVLVDPETLEPLQSLTLPEHTRFRVTAARLDGVEYLYLPGDRKIHRYRYAGGKLSTDEEWQPQYLGEDQTAGTAVAAFGDWLIVQTNGIPARAPLSIVAISQRDAMRHFRIDPFGTDRRRGSFMPSMPTVDVDNRRIYAFDGYAGELAALEFDPQRGLSLSWKQAQHSFAFSALIGPPEARVLIATDIGSLIPKLAMRYLDMDLKRALMRYARPSREALVWRDAASGAELGRSQVIAAVGGSVIAPGADGALYVPDLQGKRLIRLAATRTR